MVGLYVNLCGRCERPLVGRYVSLDTPEPTTYVSWCPRCWWAVTLDGRQLVVGDNGVTEPVAE